MALHTAVARSEVTCVYAINVNNSNMVFSPDDHVIHVLIKLLRQEKVYDAKNLLQNFPAAVDTVRIKQTVA